MENENMELNLTLDSDVMWSDITLPDFLTPGQTPTHAQPNHDFNTVTTCPPQNQQHTPPTTTNTDPRAPKRRRGENDDTNITPPTCFEGADDWEDYIYANRSYSPLYNHSQTELSGTYGINIEVDKLSQKESFFPQYNAFILYRLNQFSVSCELTGVLSHYSTLQPPNSANNTTQQLYIDHNNVLVPVSALYCHIYAVKQTRSELHTVSTICIEEQIEQVVELIQIGGTNRKKETKVPEPVPFLTGSASYPKLQFRNATANNARLAANQPNPSQEYYRIVASLIATTTPEYTTDLQTFHFIMSKISPFLIVRGQNPGKYKDTVQGSPKGEEQTKSPDSSGSISPLPSNTVNNWDYNLVERALTTFGKVGINTSTPQEALSVHGNVLITGDILKPSDIRLKSNFVEVDTAKQLENIERLKLYDYELTDSGTKERGVIAQELQQVLPSAVRVIGSMQLRDNAHVPDLLVVNDRALLLENIGATQQLGHAVRNDRVAVDMLSNHVDNLIQQGKQDTISVKSMFGDMIDFMLSEEELIDSNSVCCYFSMAGLGPAWTLFILGFILLPFLWLPGLCYIASNKEVRRVAGLSSFVALLVYVALSVVLAMYTPPQYVLIVDLAIIPFLGILSTVILVYFFKRKRAKKQKDAIEALKKLKQALLTESNNEKRNEQQVTNNNVIMM